MTTRLAVGDLITVPGRLGTTHAGIFAGDGGVIHASKDDGRVLDDSFQRFSGGLAVSIAKRATPGMGAEVVRHARALIGRPYDLLTWNCEHLATYAAEGEARSPQLRGGLFALASFAAVSAYAFATRGWDGEVGRYRDSNGRFTRGWW